MSRKLMCLITPQGKTPEELGQACYDAVKKYEKTGEVTLDLAKPQAEWEEEIRTKAKKLGLIECEVCGEYKSKRTKANVLCSCSDIVCSKCKINKTSRPISNHFSKEDGKIWHTPYFLYLCKNCR